MKQVFTLFALLFIFKTDAQNWCTPGARWVYREDFFGGVDLKEYVYSKDTLLFGQQDCHLLEVFYKSYNYFTSQHSSKKTDNAYTYSRNDSVFWLFDGTFRLTVAYNHVAGDTLDLYHFNGNCFPTPSRFLIDSVTIWTSPEGKIRKHFHYSVLNPDTFPRGFQPQRNVSAIESVGFINNNIFINLSCVIDGSFPILSCYKDDSISYAYNPNCNRLTNSIEDLTEEMPILLHNLISDKIALNINTPTTVSLFNLEGKMLWQKQMSSDIEVDTHSLQIGLYILKAQSQHSQKSYRLMKVQ